MHRGEVPPVQTHAFCLRVLRLFGQKVAHSDGGRRNSANFRQTFFQNMSWEEISPEIRDGITQLGHAPLARSLCTEEINALTCHAPQVLRIFALPGSLSTWRDQTKMPMMRSDYTQRLESKARRTIKTCVLLTFSQASLECRSYFQSSLLQKSCCTFQKYTELSTQNHSRKFVDAAADDRVPAPEKKSNYI